MTDGFCVRFCFDPVSYSGNLMSATITKIMSGPLGEDMSKTTRHDVFANRDVVAAKGGFAATHMDAAIRAEQIA